MKLQNILQVKKLIYKQLGQELSQSEAIIKSKYEQACLEKIIEKHNKLDEVELNLQLLREELT